MAWWDDVGNAVADFVDSAADAVGTVVNGAGDAVADVVETAGNAAQDGLDAVASFWGTNNIVGGTATWIGGNIAGITNFVGATIKAVFGIVGGVIEGVIRILGGVLSWHGELVLQGIVDIGSGIIGGVIAIVLTFAGYIQRGLYFVQTHDRPLTKEEKTRLRIVFRNSLALYNIRLIEGRSGIFGSTTTGAFTLCNTIYLNARARGAATG